MSIKIGQTEMEKFFSTISISLSFEGAPFIQKFQNSSLFNPWAVAVENCCDNNFFLKVLLCRIFLKGVPRQSAKSH